MQNENGMNIDLDVLKYSDFDFRGLFLISWD